MAELRVQERAGAPEHGGLAAAGIALDADGAVHECRGLGPSGLRNRGSSDSPKFP